MSEHDNDRAWLDGLKHYTRTELEIILARSLLPEWKFVAVLREIERRDNLARVVLKSWS